MRSNKIKWIIPGILTVVLGTAGAIFINKTNIDNDLTSRSQSLLDSNDLSWAKVEFDARDATILGTASDEKDQQKAENLIKDLYGVRSVINKTDLLPAASPYPFTVKVDQGSITLLGSAPNDKIRNSLGEKAGASSNLLNLNSGYPEKDSWEKAASFAIEKLDLFENGQVSLSDLSISASGTAKSQEAFDQLKNNFTSNIPDGVTASEVNILPPFEKPYLWSVQKDKDGKISIEGFAPNEEIYNQIGQTVDGAANNMLFAQGEPEDFEKNAVASINAVSLLDKGEVSYDGNGWTLDGKAPSIEVLETIKSKLDSSWQIAASAPPPPPPPPPPSPLEPVVPTALPYLWAAEKNTDNSYVLSGYVPQESLKQYFLLNAGEASKGNLEIAIGEPAGFSDNAKAALAALTSLEQGRAAYNGTQWALVGLVSSQDAKQAVLDSLKASADISSWLIDIKAPIPVASPSYRFVATKPAKGAIALNGDVPNEGIKEIASSEAGKVSGDDLNIDFPAPDGFETSIVKGLNALKMLENGQLSFRSKSWFLTGQAKDEATKGEVLTAIAGIDGGENWNVKINLLPPPPVASPSYRFVATKSAEGAIVLNGDIPTIELQNYVGILAGKVSTDNLVIDFPAPDNFKRSLFSGIHSLNALDSGQLSYRSKSWFISGVAKDEEVKEAALSAIAGIDGSENWNVKINLPPPPAPEPEVVAPEPKPAPKPAPVASLNYRFVATLKNGNAIALNGDVPSTELRNYIGVLAGKVSTDNLVIDSPAPDDFKRSLFTGLRSLKLLENGQLSYRSQKWYLVGEAENKESRDKALAAVASLPNTDMWSANVRIKNSLADTCNANVAIFAQNNAILFDFNESIIKPESDIILQHLALLLNKCPQTDIHVQGHTDSDGSESFNLTLSVDRAEAVLNALVDRGIDADRMFAIGYGESVPVDDNNTVSGRGNNRRTVFSVYKKTD